VFRPSKKIKYLRLEGAVQSWSATETDNLGSVYHNVVFIDTEGDRFEVDRLIVPTYLMDPLVKENPAEYYFAKVQHASQVLASLISIKTKVRSFYRQIETEKILSVMIRGLSVRHSLVRYYAITAGIGGWILWAIVAGTFAQGSRVGLVGSILSILIPALWAGWLIYPTAFWRGYGNIATLNVLLKDNMVTDMKNTNSNKY
jgi:hypothetical protein